MIDNFIKILWLSNSNLSEIEKTVSGGWQRSIATALLRTGKVKITQISYGDIKEITESNNGPITNWIIPSKLISTSGQPNVSAINLLKKIEVNFKPDVIHIWGTEEYWASIATYDIFQTQILLEMQGLIHACSRVFYGGMSFLDLIKCISLKEILKPYRHLLLRKKSFDRRGFQELKIIKKFANISTQSDWVRAHIKFESPNSEIFATGILLREEFYSPSLKNHSYTHNIDPAIIFTTSAGLNSFKGLHTLFRAFALVCKIYPNTELRIGGNLRGGRLLDGYMLWLDRLAKKLEIQNSIKYVGPLTALQVIDNLKSATVVVTPSFVETYSVATMEAMILGAPVVASYAGAMPELAQDNLSALYFPPGDHVACAWQIVKIIENGEFACEIGSNARKFAVNKTDYTKIVNGQIEIYREVMLKNKINLLV